MRIPSFALLVLTLGLAAAPGQASIVDVAQSGFGFTPQNVTIQVGDTVRWNWSSFAHTVTEGTDGLINGNEAWTSPLDVLNPQFSFTFTPAFVAANPRPGGVYDYFCSPHFLAGMRGTVTVNSDPGLGFCFGDGSATACPCANSSAPGAGAGCLNSLGTGGKLAGSGSASVSNDTVVLSGTAMPNSSALYFQGTAQQAAGLGAVFGDGLRCAAGSVIRLGTKTNVSGGSTYPVVGDLAVSVKGACTAGVTRHYQVWYRNAAAFCTASTFNLSNGYTLVWQA
ncbi:MAG: plastocyanin/azurin family copper-binding protein [Planctomycetota bacterium]|nr:plastocyanin/azurin family copper-binding protein [Planctomycetota bacterium]